MLRPLEVVHAAEGARDTLSVARAGARGFVSLTVRAVKAAMVVAVVACSHEQGAANADVGTAHPATGPETDCASCHPQHVDEWKISSHAYAMKDPVFHAMVTLGQRETAGALGNFCVKCHSPIGNATGQTVVVEEDGGVFTQRMDGLDTGAMDGVSCLVCHSITQVNGTANAEFDMKQNDVRHGPIADPEPSTRHLSESSDLFEKTPICGTCHVVVNPKNVALERTHIEWVQSIFNGSKSCQDCHMPSRQGPAAVGHRTRTVHDHVFAGPDVSLLPDADFPGYDELRSRSQDLMKSAARLSIAQPAGVAGLDVEIQNLAGHDLPSGATADRELWVELVVRDAAGRSVLESGTLDERGDLRVSNPDRTTRPGSDPELVLFTQQMLLDPKIDDPTSTAPAVTVDFLWQPNAESSSLLRPEETARAHYDLSSLPSGTYTATARLLFRAFPPHLMRKLAEAGTGLSPEVGGRVPTVEMALETVNLSLP